jgi:hypothetical protein
MVSPLLREPTVARYFPGWRVRAGFGWLGFAALEPVLATPLRGSFLYED